VTWTTHCGVYAPLRETDFDYILYSYFIFIMSFIFSISPFQSHFTYDQRDA